MSPAAASTIVLCADATLRDRVAFWLRAAGVKVAVANSGRDAKAIMSKGTARLLITDRLLPPWPGLDTANELKRVAGKGRVSIAYIAQGNIDERSLALAAGADVVLAWPLARASVLSLSTRIPAEPGNEVNAA